MFKRNYLINMISIDLKLKIYLKVKLILKLKFKGFKLISFIIYMK